MLFLDATCKRKRESEREHDKTDYYVGRVQADQRVIRRAKEVGLDGEAFIVNEVIPLFGGGGQKDGSQQNGDREMERGGAVVLFAQRTDGEVNEDAAREQTDGAEDGELENLRGGGTAEALADVVDVGDDKDDEDRGLGDDQAGHANVAAIRQLPRSFDWPVDWDSACCRDGCHLFVVRVWIFRVLQIP